MKAKQAGFTLVEIAIVLVIIGLLLGGVLKGQELITQARIKNVVNDINGIGAAVYAYQDRYKALPGDDTKVATRWTGVTPAPVPGDGNGTIAPAAVPSGSTLPSGEALNFWQHLRLAGLIAGDTSSTSPPLNAVSGQITVNDSDAVTGTGSTLNLAGIVVCTSNLPGKIAEAVDSQIDDGKPDKGSVMAIDGAAKATAYVDDGTKQYKVCKAI